MGAVDSVSLFRGRIEDEAEAPRRIRELSSRGCLPISFWLAIPLPLWVPGRCNTARETAVNIHTVQGLCCKLPRGGKDLCRTKERSLWILTFPLSMCVLVPRGGGHDLRSPPQSLRCITMSRHKRVLFGSPRRTPQHKGSSAGRRKQLSVLLTQRKHQVRK